MNEINRHIPIINLDQTADLRNNAGGIIIIPYIGVNGSKRWWPLTHARFQLSKGVWIL
jgi:hypothetical protein